MRYLSTLIMHITFIQTGGTIDKDYPRGDMDHGYEFAVTDPAVRSMLLHCHAMFAYSILELLKKDSLDITPADRQYIVKTISSLPDTRIVITHGTDTILKTARALDAEITGKTIVLTGAMLPDKFITSDAKFNVGMAVGAVQTLPAGIYIALYGRVVGWQEFEALHHDYEASAAK